jgi:predicted phage terminase large subunit-like protein
MPILQRDNKTTLTNADKFARAEATDSLYEFVRQAWPVIEPGRQFVDGPHIAAICMHLEALIDGRILRILVNMPPRHAKSSIIAVLAFVWSWIKNPSLRWLCSSYALSLATRDNVKCRRLIQSQWFQERYGHLLTLRKDQNAKIKFENDKNGYRQAVSVGSSATGEGGDILLIDDPHSIDEKRSDATREGTLEWFRDNWYTRRNDPQTTRMIVVGQRVHEQDLSGFILEGETGEEWVHLNLATEFEPGLACHTTLTDGTPFWHDWRKLEGELLWPERFPQKFLDRAKRRHGPMGYAALYQQRPVPAKGSIYSPEHRRFFTIDETTGCYLLETPRGIKPIPKKDCWLFATIDLAISQKQTADFFVIQAWAVTPFRDLLLLDCFREHLSHPEQQDQVYLIHQRFLFQLVAIESIAYQLALIQDLLLRGVPCVAFHPPADKVTRASTMSIWCRNGKSYHLKDAPWLFVLEKELFKFPKAPKDDQADCYSMAGLVACTYQTPGMFDPDTDEAKEIIDTAQAIELILDAEEIATEQAKQEAEANTQKPIDPFVWAATHLGGDF